MKRLLILVACHLLLVTGNANSQLPANPWAPQKTPEPAAQEVEPEPQILTYDDNLPIDPWGKFKKKEPIKPQTKNIPEVDGLSINPIDAMIEQQRRHK